MTRYPCLVLDHDDTAVMSTPCIHYPSFCNTLRHLRPAVTLTLPEYVRLSFDPGFEKLCYDILHFTKEEMDWQLENWKSYVRRTVPDFHPGMKELILRQKAEGGLVCVVSHSYSHFILRDYAAAALPAPDCVIGWEEGSDRQKPNPWPIHEIMRRYPVSLQDMLVVDDLKPGFDMARAAGCDFAAALWAYDNEDIRDVLRGGSRGGCALESVEALSRLLFS